ncbi:putative transcription factor C2H2 family [Dioscorea sansibarensis]
MEKHTCRLCARSFANGRALGGHMRSHATPTRTASASSSSSPDGVQDRESETGSPLGSSISDASPEENVAISLMMLSRDFWSSLQSKAFAEDELEHEPEPGPTRPAKRSRYQCSTCKRVFRSYQALGGHRASHKKGGKGSIPNHRQIHGVESSENNAEKSLRSSSSPKIPSFITLIDLNLPAPMDDDVEHSTVSDAHPW